MVPALIQHCVNEIEVRGLQTVGLYRVPGPEKEVKDLKERFLRGKGTPNLSRYEIHAVCGCVKDFLRSLQEPIVGRWFWKDFTVASEIPDPIKRQVEFNRIVQELPPPNQDTLAFMILHMQRIAETPEVKMPIGNLAKVFGPTIVGYSTGGEIEPANMLKETKKQQMVLETLLSMHGEFWKRFIYRPTAQDVVYNTRSKKGGQRLSGTPNGGSKSKASTFGGHGKKIYFTDESPKEVHYTRQKKTYFD
jgi:Rac GTPase-activating protein 1